MRRVYGASPLHLLGHLAVIAASAYALSLLLRAGGALVWLIGAIVLHDLVLLPAYSALDRLAQAAVRDSSARPVALMNHVRVPAALSGLVLLVYFPAILGLNSAGLQRVSGRIPNDTADGTTWLVLTAAAFLVSAIVYLVRVRRSARRRPTDP